MAVASAPGDHPLNALPHAGQAARIRVFIVDDHPMVRFGVAAAMRAEPEFELLGEAASGEEALQRLPALSAEVVLMDLVLPGIDGIEAVAALAPQMPGTRFVILTSLLEPDSVRRAMAAGASGFLLKTASAHELATAVRNTHRGRPCLAPEAAQALWEGCRPTVGTDLTSRERDLLAAMARGSSNKQIADELAIATATVKFHITNVLGKLGVNNRTEAVLLALKHRLVPAP